jgi:peptide/nickel transport system substrate-binding protein
LSRRPFDQSKERLSTTLLIACLIACSLAASLGSSTQPPIDPTVYNVATIGQPSRIDPARAYDSASGELIQNVYQTLIWYSDKHPVVFTPGVGYNLTVADYSDLTRYKPVLATEVPTTENGRLVVNASGSYWRFTINTSAVFQPWTAANGSIMPSRAVTADDVVYSFRRQIVYDSPDSPDWMWMSSAFGIPSWIDVYKGLYPTYYNGTFVHVADEASAAAMIQQWCYNIANDVYFHFQLPWVEGIMKQLFSQTWGSIVNPDWVKEMGGWDGLFTTGASDANMMAGWSNNYHWKPTDTRSELDAYKSGTTFPGHGSKYPSYVPRMCGTGPYALTSWDIVNKVWRIDRFPAYWMGWADAGDKVGNCLSTVIWREVASWPTRKMLFLEGEFDVAVVAVPRANMHDLLTTDAYTPIPGINLVYNIPDLLNRVELLSLNTSYGYPNSGYPSYVGYPTHKTAEPYFFNNTHLRRAFAWALNYTAYIQDAWSGEAIVQRSWWVDGLSPQSYKNTNASMPQRNLNYTEMQNELNQAIVDGFNVSQEGFETSLLYTNGNDEHMIALQLIADAFHSLNPKYKVNVVGYTFVPVLGFNMDARPNYAVSWLADFADPDNFCEPYQASSGGASLSYWGSFMGLQGPPFPEDQAFVDQEIHAALVEPDFAKRGAMYQDLQYRYWVDVPSFPLVQLVGRRWARDWVQGWYFNALLPGLYAYDLYKSTTPLESVDVDMTATVTPTSPTYNPVYIFHNQMRKGNGDASPASMTYNLHVTRNDNNSAIPILYVAVGLTYTTGGNKQFANGTYVALPPGGSANVNVTWWADGVNQIMTGNSTGIPYSVAGEAQPMNANANDSDTGNNQQAAGTLIAMTLPGDVTGDGLVDIYDAITLAGVYGIREGDPRWNPDANLNTTPDPETGRQIIDIYDAIILADNYNRHVP